MADTVEEDVLVHLVGDNDRIRVLEHSRKLADIVRTSRPSRWDCAVS